MFKLLLILFWSAPGFADFDELGKREDLFNLKTDPLIKVVQKRWLDRKFLSELGLSISPNLRGFYYMNNWSSRLSYRLYLNDSISLHLKYAYFFNPINQDGEDELSLYGRIPLELKHAPKQSYLAGWDWHPFYAKSVFFNRVLHFDFYVSMGLGRIELLEIQEKPFLISGSLGMVHWWSKRFNTRIELEGLHYRYLIHESNQKTNQELNYNLNLSAGVLF